MTKLTFCGPSASGKTSALNLLLGNPPDLEHHSTPVVKIPETRIITVSEDSEKWEKVDYENLKRMIAAEIKETPIQSNTDETIIHESDDDDDNQTNEQQTSLPTDQQNEIITSTGQEIIGFMHTTEKGSPALDNTHWIYAVDSGGQAAFLDIAPALMRYNSANVFTLKLNEDLESKTRFQYSVHGVVIGSPVEHDVTNLQLLEASFHSASSLTAPADDDDAKPPSCFVLGTFHDEISKSKKTLKQKNEILWSKLELFRSITIPYNDGEEEIIFPVNAISRENDAQEMAKVLRRRIGQRFISKHVPAKWFLFQVELQAENVKIISIEQCEEIGKKCNLSENEVKAALKFYNDHLTVFLYFPDIKVVFLHPQPLFDTLSELISISFAVHVDELTKNGIKIPQGAHRDLKTKGMFKKDLLSYLPGSSKVFADGVFTIDRFLMLLQNLSIIAPLQNSEEYFLPCVLPTANFRIHKFSLLKKLFSKKVDPIVLAHSNMKALPRGLLSQLVVYLLDQKSFKLKIPRKDDEYQQYRNAIQLICSDLGGTVMLVNSIFCLEIYYAGVPDRCPSLLEIIHRGIVFSTSHQLNEYFHCKMQHSDSSYEVMHLCWPNSTKEVLTCCDDSTFTADINVERHLPWFSVDINIEILSAKPQLEDLFSVLKDSADHWDMLSDVLAQRQIIVIHDKTIIDLYRKHRDNLSRLHKIIEMWLEQRITTTWKDVIEILEGMEWNRKSEEIKHYLDSKENYEKYIK